MRLSKFEDWFHERLRDPEYAAGYVRVALKEGGLSEFLVALKEVASAQEGGMKGVAQASRLGRESMYKSLSENGNPRIKTIESVLSTLGLEITVAPRSAPAMPAHVAEERAEYATKPTKARKAKQTIDS